MNKKIILRKIKASANPVCLTPKNEAYIPGEDNGNVSLPIDYEVEGYATSEIKIGERLCVDRTKRNGVECTGFLRTSKITSVSENTFTTQNSVYKYEYQ